MSGIEAIGLALALWPVVGTLNDLYRSAREGGSAARWATTIRVQQRIFKECVLKLLQGDEELSEKDRLGLINGDKDFQSLWSDKEFGSRLESRLDKEMCELIEHEVREISRLVASLQKLLGENNSNSAKALPLSEALQEPSSRPLSRPSSKSDPSVAATIDEETSALGPAYGFSALDSRASTLLESRASSVFEAKTAPAASTSTAATRKKSFHLPSFRDVRCVLRKDDIKKNLESLQFHNTALRKLLKSCPSTVYADSRKPPSTSTSTTSATSTTTSTSASTSTYTSPSTAQQNRQMSFRDEQERQLNTNFFNGFYEVLGKSFRCSCPTGHAANLSISEALVMFQAGGDLSRAMSGVSDLRLRNRSATMESDATQYGDEDEDVMSEFIRSTWSRARQGSVSTAPCEHPAVPVRYGESRGVHKLAPIVDLCQWIRAMHRSPPNSPSAATTDDGQGVLGVLGDHSSSKRYTIRAPRPQYTSTAATAASLPASAAAASAASTAMKIVSMDEWLSSASSSGSGASKRWRVRAELAMNLASTILQFYPTSWIDKAWTWRNFSVARNEASQHSSLVITQRFWSADLPRPPALASPPPPSRFWTTFRDLDPMLVRLGFALIELALGKRLADIRMEAAGAGSGAGEPTPGDRPAAQQQELGDVDLADYYTAVDILNSNRIEDDVGVTYQQVVDTCLRCRVVSDVGLKPLSSDSRMFEADLEQFVVEPLRRHHSSTWGSMQITSF